MTVRLRKALSLFAILLTIVLAFSMLQLTVFADGDPETTEPTGETESTDKAETSGDATVGAGTENETETGTPETTETTAPVVDTSSTQEGKTGIQTSTIVTLIICGALVVIAVVLIVKNRVKVGAFLVSLKSEIKKIKWTKRKDVIKFTAVALTVIVSSAIIIGLLDFAFSKGIIALGTLF